MMGNVKTDFFGSATESFLQPISIFLKDPQVSEVMVNGAHEIYVEKKGRIFQTNATFEDEDQLMALARRISQAVGRRISEQEPILDARLEDGSRVHIVLPPCAKRGIYLTIRKFASTNLTLKEITDLGALTIPMAKFINLCVSLSKNIIVSGGTSSGKTTLLNVISELISNEDRIVIIEDASELQLKKPHLLPLESVPGDIDGKGKVEIRELLKAALRMRPDRIIIGEVRGGEALDMLQAMNTGHSGSMATLHANSPSDSLSRLETLALMSDVDLPWRALRQQIASAIDIVIQASRLRDGSRRITHISEVCGLESDGGYVLKDIFRFEIEKLSVDGSLVGQHMATGEIPTFLDTAKSQGYQVDETLFTEKKK